MSRVWQRVVSCLGLALAGNGGARAKRRRTWNSAAPITLVRAARELLGCSKWVLAEKANLGVITVRRYERSEFVDEDSVETILDALRGAGIAFLGAEVTPAVMRSACRPAGRPDATQIALVTARSAPAYERVIHTLPAWGVEVDEAYFVGDGEKRGVLAPSARISSSTIRNDTSPRLRPRSHRLTYLERNVLLNIGVKS